MRHLLSLILEIFIETFALCEDFGVRGVESGTGPRYTRCRSSEREDTKLSSVKLAVCWPTVVRTGPGVMIGGNPSRSLTGANQGVCYSDSLHFTFQAAEVP